MIVYDEAASRVDRELAAFLLELPAVDRFRRGELVADTLMIEQVLRRARLAMSGEIARRAEHAPAKIPRQPHRHHIPLDVAANADARVETVLHQIDRGIIHVDLDLD